MMDGMTETAGTVSTTEYGAQEYQTFETTEPVELECLCCDTDLFRHFETVVREHHSVGRFECVGCGAVSEHRIPRSQRSEGR